MLRSIKVAVGASLGHLLHQMGGDAPVAHGASNSSLANHVFCYGFLLYSAGTQCEEWPLLTNAFKRVARINFEPTTCCVCRWRPWWRGRRRRWRSWQRGQWRPTYEHQLCLENSILFRKSELSLTAKATKCLARHINDEMLMKRRYKSYLC